MQQNSKVFMCTVPNDVEHALFCLFVLRCFRIVTPHVDPLSHISVQPRSNRSYSLWSPLRHRFPNMTPCKRPTAIDIGDEWML